MFPLINFTYASFNLFLMSAACWGASLLIKNSSIIDAFFPLIFVFLACYLEYYAALHTMRSLLVTLLISVWGLRLSGYLLYRNRQGEDKRYAALRARHGKNYWWYSLVNPFMAQLVVALICSVSLVSCFDGGRLQRSHALFATFSDWIALALWSVGMVFEVGADLQLMKFKQNPKNEGKVLTSGLFAYTRHPNYFGSACIFWSMFFFSHAQGAYWTILAPVLMTANLIKGTGVELTENFMVKKHPQYRKYMETTSAFVPMPPKTRAGEAQRAVEL